MDRWSQVEDEEEDYSPMRGCGRRHRLHHHCSSPPPGGPRIDETAFDGRGPHSTGGQNDPPSQQDEATMAAGVGGFGGIAAVIVDVVLLCSKPGGVIQA